MNEFLQQARRAHEAGDLATAEQLYGEALKADAGDFDAAYLLGFLHMQRGQWESAERRMAEAIASKPQSLDALFHRGRMLQKLERAEEALASFDAAIALRPHIPEVLLGRANALLALNRVPDALAGFEAVLRLKPDSAEAWNNRGNALAMLSRGEEALASYDRALALKPGDAGIANHRAITLFERKRYEEAARGFDAVLKPDPAFAYARGNRLYAQLHACDWHAADAERAALARALACGEPVVTPIQAATFFPSPEQQSQASRQWTKDKYPASSHPLWAGEVYAHKRIRIAYLSADFHAHATAALMAGVFEHHDGSAFEIAAVSYGPDDGGAMRARLKPAFDHFLDVRACSDRTVAQTLRRMEVDIAVDLKGYTQDARPGILAHRPAPVQAQYLGFPGTMGAAHIDYIVADRFTIPPEQAQFYDEKIVTLPETYQANDSKRRIADSVPARGQAGLPESGFVFCCFNNNFKIAPEMFAIWMRLLSRIEGSVLWLLQDNPAAARNLKREAEHHGIAPERLVFAGRIGLEQHLARHALADLFLDTLPYGAHTTASDALWAGLPVLTCASGGFAGRVAAGLVSAAGLPDLIAADLADYEALALRFAREPAALAAVKARLARNRATCPLFDTVRFTRNLETAYARMCALSRSGQPATSFQVEPGTHS